MLRVQTPLPAHLGEWMGAQEGMNGKMDTSQLRKGTGRRAVWWSGLRRWREWGRAYRVMERNLALLQNFDGLPVRKPGERSWSEQHDPRWG